MGVTNDDIVSITETQLTTTVYQPAVTDCTILYGRDAPECKVKQLELSLPNAIKIETEFTDNSQESSFTIIRGGIKVEELRPKACLAFRRGVTTTYLNPLDLNPSTGKYTQQFTDLSVCERSVLNSADKDSVLYKSALAFFNPSTEQNSVE